MTEYLGNNRGQVHLQGGDRPLVQHRRDLGEARGQTGCASDCPTSCSSAAATWPLPRSSRWGLPLAAGDEVASIETIKVNISLLIAGQREDRRSQPGHGDAPEAINQDPYGAGWLAVIEAADWETQKGPAARPAGVFCADDNGRLKRRPGN